MIVIGASAGGIETLTKIFGMLPKDCKQSICVVQHMPSDMPEIYIDIVSENCPLTVKEAFHNELILPGHIYFAPAGYHLLVEKNGLLTLSDDGVVQYARPSIDVLFESASANYGKSCMAFVLTGANDDGANGAQEVVDCGGEVYAQDPKTAKVDVMPMATITKLNLPKSKILSPKRIAQKIAKRR